MRTPAQGTAPPPRASPACAVTLATSTTGRGEAVLLVHGWSGFKEAWLTLPRALADAGFAAMAVDLPGWGESPAPRGRATPRPPMPAPSRARSRAAWPAHLIAHSMGAQAGIVLALRRPGPRAGWC